MSAQVAVTTVQHSSAVHGSAAQAMEEAVSLMLLPLDVQSIEAQRQLVWPFVGAAVSNGGELLLLLAFGTRSRRSRRGWR